jgi:hypothetical protein
MQPALAEVVQKPTVPGSTATTGARLAASRSLPWCDGADDGEEQLRHAVRGGGGAGADQSDCGEHGDEAPHPVER